MSTEPHEPVEPGPVTEVIPNHLVTRTGDPPAVVTSADTQVLTVPGWARPSSRRRSRLPWLIGAIAALALAGTGVWYWWFSGTSPVRYKTALVDRSEERRVGKECRS